MHLPRVPVVLLVAAACHAPSDIVSDAPRFTPLQDRDGRYRVTFGAGPDVGRGFMPDGRLLFRAYDLVPFGAEWVLVSVPADGGDVREEAGVYRPALLGDMGALVSDGSRRALVVWKAPLQGVHACPDSSLTSAGDPGPAPRPPTPIELAIYSLPAQDVPVLSVPVRPASMHAAILDSTGTEGTTFVEWWHVRVTPALRDVNRTATNAFGPAMLPGANEMIYSDGEQLWRADMRDSSVPPVSLGMGAYPALSPDGRSLAYARPLGVDSTTQQFRIPVALWVCYQTQVEITADAWEVVIRDLESGTEDVVADGLDPAWDPTGTRLVVRDQSLSWIDLATGTTSPIAATQGAFAPAVSPDGRVLAFSLFSSGSNTDVYFVLIP